MLLNLHISYLVEVISFFSLSSHWGTESFEQGTLGTFTLRKDCPFPKRSPRHKCRERRKVKREERETDTKSDKFRLLPSRTLSDRRFGRMSKVPILFWTCITKAFVHMAYEVCTHLHFIWNTVFSYKHRVGQFVIQTVLHGWGTYAACRLYSSLKTLGNGQTLRNRSSHTATWCSCVMTVSLLTLLCRWMRGGT